jgi:hypothetical protein
MMMKLKCADGPLAGRFAQIDLTIDSYVLIPSANGTRIDYFQYAPRKTGGGFDLVFIPSGRAPDVEVTKAL